MKLVPVLSMQVYTQVRRKIWSTYFDVYRSWFVFSRSSTRTSDILSSPFHGLSVHRNK